MKSFEFNGDKYNLPESWKDVTLRQLIQVIKEEREDLPPLMKSAKIISALTGLDYEVMVNSESGLIIKLFSCLDFLDHREVSGEIKEFVFGKETYQVNSLQGSIFKEFATFHKIDSDFEKKQEDGIALKLAMLCRKKGETFNEVEDELMERAEMFLDLDAETVFRINGFFLHRMRLLQISLEVSTQLAKAGQDKEQHLLELLTASSAGRPWRTKWLGRLHRWSMSLIVKLPTS